MSTDLWGASSNVVLTMRATNFGAGPGDAAFKTWFVGKLWFATMFILCHSVECQRQNASKQQVNADDELTTWGMQGS